MGAFDCPTCGEVRHINDGEDGAPDVCWQCGTPVPETLTVHDIDVLLALVKAAELADVGLVPPGWEDVEHAAYKLVQMKAVLEVASKGPAA